MHKIGRTEARSSKIGTFIESMLDMEQNTAMNKKVVPVDFQVAGKHSPQNVP